jgi:hypothetical protein
MLMLSVLPAAPGHGCPFFFALYEKSRDFDIRRAEGVLSREKGNYIRLELSIANTNRQFLLAALIIDYGLKHKSELFIFPLKKKEHLADLFNFSFLKKHKSSIGNR